MWPHDAEGGQAWDACNGPGWPRTVLAYATKNSLFYDNKPDEIQLCTWYLRWMYPEKFKLSTAVHPSWLENVLPETQAILDRARKTPMDLRTGESSFPTRYSPFYHIFEAEHLFHLKHPLTLEPSWKRDAESEIIQAC